MVVKGAAGRARVALTSRHSSSTYSCMRACTPAGHEHTKSARLCPHACGAAHLRTMHTHTRSAIHTQFHVLMHAVLHTCGPRAHTSQHHALLCPERVHPTAHPQHPTGCMVQQIVHPACYTHKHTGRAGDTLQASAPSYAVQIWLMYCTLR